MAVLTLLERARAAGLTVWATGPKLNVRGPKRLAALAGELIARKQEVLAELEREQNAELPALVADWPPDWIEAFEERAGIMQFDGGLARSDAERDAEVSVRRAYRDSAAAVSSRMAAPPAPSDTERAAPRPNGEPLRPTSLFGHDADRTVEEPADRTGGRRSKRSSGGAA